MKKALRGDQLSEHILWVAKEVFLEVGFERASMDVIATRASTSKATLYVHFKNKEKLYLRIVDMVRGLVVSALKTPDDYSGNATEALVMFCGRFLEILIRAHTIKMCRASIAEAGRFPEGAARYFDVILSIPHERVSAYLQKTFGLSAATSIQEAELLLGRVIHPRFSRALFGLDELSEQLDDDAIRADFDLEPVRRAVVECLRSIKRRPRPSRRSPKRS